MANQNQHKDSGIPRNEGTAKESAARRKKTDPYSIQEYNKLQYASAPYNFVKHDRVLAIPFGFDGLPPHDAFYRDFRGEKRYQGAFEVTLTTETPTFIRSPLTLQKFEAMDRKKKSKNKAKEERSQEAGEQQDKNRQELIKKISKETKNRPRFYYISNPKRPVLPPSSINGMLRNVLEIVSFSKLNRVSTKTLHYRDISFGLLARKYRGKFIKKSMGASWLQTRGGFLRKDTDDNWYIDTCFLARVAVEETEDIDSGASRYFSLEINHRRHFEVNRKPVTTAMHLASRPKEKAERESKILGQLLKTGLISSKKRHFVFISYDSIPDLHKEQLQGLKQPFSQQTFPLPSDTTRFIEDPNKLKDGAPVFFLTKVNPDTNKEVVEYCGSAGMFRLPHKNTPYDLLSEQDTDPLHIDLAESIFGFVRSAVEQATIKKEQHISGPIAGYTSRIKVLPGIHLDGSSSDVFEETIIPKVLASPKVTAFQHYLNQDEHLKDNVGSNHYSTANAKLSGWKRYWLQGKDVTIDKIEVDNDSLSKVAKSPKQYTTIKPTTKDQQFCFRIEFTNLSKMEVGALAWVLNISQLDVSPYASDLQFRHQIGMGRPYGMGTVNLNAKLFLTDRVARYKSLFALNEEEGWETGESIEEDLDSFSKAFEKFMLKALGEEDANKPFWAVDKIARLLRMMEFPGYPAVKQEPQDLFNREIGPERYPNTRYMDIKTKSSITIEQAQALMPNAKKPHRFRDLNAIEHNEYRTRPILRGPEAFGPLLSELYEANKRES